MLFLSSQVAQLAYIMDERLKEAAENVDWERALKDVAVVIANDKGEVTAATEKRVVDFEKDVKLGSTELKLAEAESLNLAQVDEIKGLMATLGACEDKWYNTGFTDAENSTEPIVHEARKLISKRAGWLPFKPWGFGRLSIEEPKQIPFPKPPSI